MLFSRGFPLLIAGYLMDSHSSSHWLLLACLLYTGSHLIIESFAKDFQFVSFDGFIKSSAVQNFH